MPPLPATGRGPVGLPNLQLQVGQLASGALRLNQQILSMPPQDRPARYQPDAEDLVAPNARPAAQGQGPEGGSNIPPEVLGGGLGAIRAVLGREAFEVFLRRLAFITIGPANTANALAFGAGFVFDPIRYVYEQGLALVIPRPPVRPIEGLLTPGANTVLGAFYNLFDSDALDRQRALKRLRIVTDLERLLREGRINPNDPRLLETERRLNIRVPRPGERQAQEELNRQLAVAFYLLTLAPQLFGEVGEEVNVPPVPRGSVDP